VNDEKQDLYGSWRAAKNKQRFCKWSVGPTSFPSELPPSFHSYLKNHYKTFVLHSELTRPPYVASPPEKDLSDPHCIRRQFHFPRHFLRYHFSAKMHFSAKVKKGSRIGFVCVSQRVCVRARARARVCVSKSLH
jgi:hypothetical protein